MPFLLLKVYADTCYTVLWNFVFFGCFNMVWKFFYVHLECFECNFVLFMVYLNKFRKFVCGWFSYMNGMVFWGGFNDFLRVGNGRRLETWWIWSFRGGIEVNYVIQNSIHLGVGFIVKSKNSEFSFKIVQNSAPQPCHSFTSLQFK